MLAATQLNEMAGGGEAGEAKEDKLDKSECSVSRQPPRTRPIADAILPLHDARAAIDWVQEHVLKQGQQSDESAQEQFKDEQISDFIRKEFKTVTGHDIPVKDKS